MDPSDSEALNRLPHLDACLTETLRLWPGLLTGGPRKTGKNGVWIAGRFIPPETTIVAPQYVISRRKCQPRPQFHVRHAYRILDVLNRRVPPTGEEYFVRAREFIPERWTSSPELVLNAGASAPFGTGTTNCLGRVLATNVIKCTAARLIRKYTFTLAPGDDARGVGSEVRDTLMPRPGNLSLCFKLRGKEAASAV